MPGTPRPTGKPPAARYEDRVKKLNLEVDLELVERLDAYCEAVDRSRNGAVRFLLHKALRQYEEDTGENTRPG